jgi:serine/threonine protein kinase
LNYLKAFGVVHRDLKLENIMMTDDTNRAIPKLIDFGLARILLPGETTTEPYGTLGYVSPEILRKDAYSFQCDVWSLGCITFALISGSLPFDDKEPQKTIFLTKESPLRFDLPCWRHVSLECMDFIN